MALLHKSVQWGLDHLEQTLASSMASSTKGLHLETTDGEKYIEMYVNEDSLKIQPDVVTAMNELFQGAHQKGICPSTTLDTKDIIKL